MRRFLNYYNAVKPHKGIDNLTPFEKLEMYFKKNRVTLQNQTFNNTSTLSIQDTDGIINDSQYADLST